MSFRDRLEVCARFTPGAYRPLIIAGCPLGRVTHAFASSGALVMDQQVILSDSVCARAGRDYCWHIRIWYAFFGARVVESPPVSVQGGGACAMYGVKYILYGVGGTIYNVNGWLARTTCSH